jgi:hypothetical protein
VTLGLKKMLNILDQMETQIKISLYTENFPSSGMHRLEEF